MGKRVFWVILLSFWLAGIPAKAFKLPHYQRLCQLLPDLSGWRAEKCDGMNMNTPMGEMVSAQRAYSKGNKSIEVAIFYGIQAAQYWAPFTYSLEVDSNEEYIKTTTIEGFPVGIEYNKKDHSGAVVVCLKNKPPANLAIFGLNFSNMSWKEALKLAQKFDWKSIAKVFASN